MNVLKSLVEWEKICHDSERLSENTKSNGEDNMVGQSMEAKNREDVSSNFEKAKAHKSTLEAAISEVHIII